MGSSNKTKYVWYLRVSTKEQGLSLASQYDILHHFLKGREQLFEEKKSATTITQRPELLKAIEYCKEHGCVLAVAKVDRLSRNVDDIRFIHKKLGGKIMACDIPQEGETMDLFMLTIYASFAERERTLISIRTKQALQVLKARGVCLGMNKKGGYNMTKEYQRRAVKAIKEKARSHPNTVRAIQLIRELRGKGLSYQEIANQLNSSGFKTNTEHDFTSIGVWRIYTKYINKRRASVKKRRKHRNV